MTDKTQVRKREVPKRLISLIMLFAILSFSLAALSYAWYRNYVDIEGTDIKTGKISLDINGYIVDDAHNVTSVSPITVNGETENSVVIESSVIKINSFNSVCHAYYFIKNPSSDGSVDLDTAITVSLDNTTIDEALYGITVSIKEVSTGSLGELDSLTDDEIKAIIRQSSQNGISSEEGSALNNLGNVYTEVSVEKGSYSCIRITYKMPDSVQSYGALDLGLRISFSLAQKNGLPNGASRVEYVVYSLENLQSIIGKYRAGDKIIVKGNIEYKGDLILNKPISLEIQSAELNIVGRLVLAYPYQGRYAIDTSRGGSISVFTSSIEIKDGEGNITEIAKIGGSIDIDTPLCQVELIGKNSESATLGDIYVEGDVNVNASIPTAGSLYGQGLVINGSNVYPIISEKGDCEGFKELNIESRTRVYVMNYSKVGNIVSSGSVIEIENRGTVDGIDLTDMIRDEDHLDSYPQIYINNYGILTDTGISLPVWADKFANNGDNTYTGNTRILSQPGSGAMTVDSETDGFISDGSRDPARDDIEYIKLETFVERVNGRSDEILVQYTRDTGLYLVGTSTDIGSSLRTLIGYYMGNIAATEISGSENGAYVNSSLKIDSKELLTYLKIECYSATELLEDDYTFIREMSGLVSLDLSGAASEGLKTPDDAFLGLSSLKSVEMSQFDTEWGTNIFSGTAVDEIRLPDSLISVTSDATLTGIRYVHTAARFVENIRNGTRLLFVPDATTHTAYNNADNYGRVFYDADRYSVSTGDYFLRLDTEGKRAELAAYMPRTGEYTTFNAAAEKNGEAAFDFNNITVNGIEYSVRVFGSYSFYGKTVTGVADGTLALNGLVEDIEPYAFGNMGGISTLTFEGSTNISDNGCRGLKVNTVNLLENSYIGKNAFTACEAIVINAPKVAETGTNSFSEMTNLQNAYFPSLRRTNEPFYGCTGIYRLDIGIFEKGTMFGQNCTNTLYTFIHIAEDDSPDNYTYQLSYTGVDVTSNGSRFLFVPSSYAKIYTNYGTRIDIGDSYVESVHEYYDPDDVNLVNGLVRPTIYYLDNNDGTVEILKFHKAAPTTVENIFKVPKRDGSGDLFTVTRIAEYAYRGITVTANELIFPDSVKEVGAYGFADSNKTIARIDLNNIERVYRHAFEGNSSAVVVGEKLVYMGDYAFASNTKLLYVRFPLLRQGEKTDTYGNYFASCTALRYAYVGPLDNGIQSQIFSGCSSLKFVIIDATDRVKDAKIPSNLTLNNRAIFLVIGDSSMGFSNARQVDPDFSNVLACGSVKYSSTVNGVTQDIFLPETFYRIDDDGRSAELLKCSAKQISMAKYIIPVQAIPTGETSTFFGIEMNSCTDTINENDSGYPVRKIAPYVYSGVSFGETVFNTGPYITSIEAGTLDGINAKYLELENVEYLGRNALHGCVAESIKAEKVRIGEYWSFGNCVNLKELYVPAIEEMRSWFIYGCTNLKKLTVGEQLRKMGEGEFTNCPSLTDVIFLSSYKIEIPSDAFIHTSYTATNVDNLTLHVRTKFLDEYTEEWGDILKDIVSIEEEYTDTVTGITYYYNDLGDGKAEISYFTVPDGYSMGNTFAFPSQLTVVNEDLTSTTYTVTQVNNMALDCIESFGTVKTLILPDGIETLVNNIESIPDTVEDLVISNTNTIYKTVDGVLYSANEKSLLLYPKGRTDISFQVPNAVESIAIHAFNGNTYIQSITFNSPVIISTNAFYGCSSLESVTFTSETVSMFIGKDIFTGCSEELKIYVPAASINAYKEALIFDYEANNRLTAITTE